jgi:hypothetical protein
MASSKISALTANTTPALTDILPMVDDPSGTPATQKVTLTSLDTLLRLNDTAFSQSATVTVASTAAETTLVGAGLGSVTLGTASQNTAGKALRVKLWGWLSNIATPTLNLKVKAGSVVLAATGDVTLGADQTDVQVEIEVDIVTRTTGATGTVFAAGRARVGVVWYPMLNTAASSALDLTSALVMNVTADWSASDAGNTIKAAIILIEKLN